LYENKTTNMGFTDYYYWSSTEGDVNLAVGQYFEYNGLQNFSDKSSNFSVRAVRAF